MTPTTSAPIGSDEQLKKDLANIAESGAGDSALQPIEMGVQALEASHPRKADLEKAKGRLFKSPKPEQRQEIAREMLKMLGPPAGAN